MKYKKLIVSGCSFTANKASWAYVLAEKYNLELVNLAVGGAGNKHILYSLLTYLAKNAIDTETTLVGIMWSHPIRNDFIVEVNPNIDSSIYRYNYDQFNKSVGGLEFIAAIKEAMPTLSKYVFHNTMLAGNANKSGITLETWTHNESAVSYLLSKHINFFQTVFMDYLAGSDLIKNNITGPNADFQKSYCYLEQLDRINLKQNTVNWVSMSHAEILGEFAYLNNKIADDKLHPSKEGYLEWTQQILIPKLQAMQLL